LTKEELFEAVWPDTVVSEDTLVQSIREIRKAIGDDSREPWFIQTFPRFGYRLIAPIEVVDGGPESTSVVGAGPGRPRPRWPAAAAVAAVPLLAGTIVALALKGRPESPIRPTPVAVAASGRTTIPADHLTDSLEAYREYSLGVAAADSLHNTEAIAHFEKAIELDGGFAMAYARIGYAYAVTWSQVERAKPYLARALTLHHRLNDRERLYVIAWQAIAHRQYARAIDHFRLIAARYPMDVEAHERLARLLIGEERLAEAIDILRRALVIHPDSPELHNALGNAESLLGRNADAIAHHQRLVALLPREANAHDSLGMSHQRAGDYERALAAYDEALRLDPEFEIAVIHRANTYWQLGRVREAIREYRRYIDLAPSPAERQRGFSSLVIVYRGMKDLERETAAVEEAGPGDAEGQVSELLLAVDRGDTEEARKIIASMRALSPSRGMRLAIRLLYFVRAEEARARGDCAEAIAHSRQAVRHLPLLYHIDDLEDVLGDSFAACGQPQAAIDEYERILQLNPNRARTRYKLARSLESLGRMNDARTEYARFVEIWRRADPDVPELVDAKARLR
jgi:tetratricopeptide (TPR) repeat protein